MSAAHVSETFVSNAVCISNEPRFSVTRLMQFFAEHDPFHEKVPFSKVNKLYLWFDEYEKFKFKQKQNYSYRINPIALTLVYSDTEINKRTHASKTIHRKTFVYHEKLLNIFNDQQLVIIMDETKTRKIPNSKNLLYLSIETTQKQFKKGNDTISYYPVTICVSDDTKINNTIIEKKIDIIETHNEEEEEYEEVIDEF